MSLICITFAFAKWTNPCKTEGKPRGQESVSAFILCNEIANFKSEG